MENEEAVLRAFEENPRTSTNAVAAAVGIPQTQVWWVMHEQCLYPYHIQRVQGLVPRDYPRRLEFCVWFMNQINVNPNFAAQIFYTDEAQFSTRGLFNTHNSHVWAEENPHEIRSRGDQGWESINVWCAIQGDNLIGPLILPNRLTGASYLQFLQQEVPFETVPVAQRREMWLQQDGAPAHNTGAVRDYLLSIFRGRLIANNGPIKWPPRSPDLTPLDFFLWGHLKTLVYDTPIRDREDLLARIRNGCDVIRNTPGILARTRRSIIRRTRLCIEERGGHFEQLL